ncbi:VanZ family protein [Flavobacterium sp. DG1-102-2]|uniref:VanZ family protein n=1 Tax=Flavobacterium sp. DG1-102-2 TaxID=3081663 RepID=UPI00294A4D66|nr:VanZ family protein [Flavobacterium sp. DG1-102-2]MDV6170278.1 VanZ family protein [Flavobacterium sp. DG1-102-2]
MAAFAWTVFIVYACLINAADIPQATWLDIPNKDKIVHFTFYFVFTFLWVQAIKTKKELSPKRVRAAVFFSAVIFGILIEVCQGVFAKERSPDVLDAIANTCGSAVSILLLWLLDKRNNKINVPSH